MDKVYIWSSQYHNDTRGFSSFIDKTTGAVTFYSFYTRNEYHHSIYEDCKLIGVFEAQNITRIRFYPAVKLIKMKAVPNTILQP